MVKLSKRLLLLLVGCAGLLSVAAASHMPWLSELWPAPMPHSLLQVNDIVHSNMSTQAHRHAAQQALGQSAMGKPDVAQNSSAASLNSSAVTQSQMADSADEPKLLAIEAATPHNVASVELKTTSSAHTPPSNNVLERYAEHYREDGHPHDEALAQDTRTAAELMIHQ